MDLVPNKDIRPITLVITLPIPGRTRRTTPLNGRRQHHERADACRRLAGRAASKASWCLAREGRCCPGRASDAAVPWHDQNGGPGARPPRYALYGQRLDDPIRRGGRRALLLAACVLVYLGYTATSPRRMRPLLVAGVDDERSRSDTRSAAAVGCELLRRLVCLPATLPVSSSPLAQPCRASCARSDGLTCTTVQNSCNCDDFFGGGCDCDSPDTQHCSYTTSCDSNCNTCYLADCNAGKYGAAVHVTRGPRAIPGPLNAFSTPPHTVHH